MITKERVLEVIQGISEGLQLKHLVVSGAERVAFMQAIERDKDCESSYRNALILRGEMAALETMDIADNEPDLYKANLQVNTRKWFASKVSPARWGEKLQLEVSANDTLATALAEAQRRLLPSSDLVIEVESKVIDTTKEMQTNSTDYKSVNDDNASNQTQCASDSELEDLLS